MNSNTRNNIVFFDGHCNLCNASINLLMKFDQKRKLIYAPLSGETSKKLGFINDFPSREESVVYYRDENQIFYYSDAAIEICVDIFLIGKAFYLFKLIPRFIRDRIYKFVGRNRYRFFGRKETCRIPSIEEKALFLD